MCFTLEWSIAIFISQLTISAMIWSLCSSWYMRRESCFIILFFSLMELIQIINQLNDGKNLEDPPWSGGCLNPSSYNKALVISGYVHVCFQPLIMHYLLWRGRVLETGREYNESFLGVLGMLVISTCSDLSLVVQPLIFGVHDKEVYDWDQCAGPATVNNSNDLIHVIGGHNQRGIWFAGRQFCAFDGDTHLGWSIPFPPPNYYRTGILNFFAFFAPFFVCGIIHREYQFFVAGISMLLSGPILSEWIVNNSRLEAASTWCFWALFQTLMPFFWDYIWNPYIMGKPFCTTYVTKQKLLLEKQQLKIY